MKISRLYLPFLLLALPLYLGGEAQAANPTFGHPSITPPAATTANTSPSAPERSLYNVTVKDAEKMVGDALVTAGVAQQVEVTLIGDRLHPLNQSGEPVKTSVENLQFDAKALRWNATLVFEDTGKSLAVQGRYVEVASIPMLTKTVDSGVKIDAGDIQMSPYPVPRLHKDTILKAEELIGKAPKRPITPNRAIRQDEITDASDIKTGAQVTLKYETKGMLINTAGETVEPGRIGNRIRVRNTSSKAIVTGTLESGNVVSITSFPN